jgi:Putative  PD-(D/E)XK family member, (DUF4420)
MNEFESRWVAISNTGHSAGRFRVYPDHVLNFYVQYSLGGFREVVIEVLGCDLPAFPLPAFRNIDLSRVPIEGGLRIGLTLLDEDLARNFSVMCYDLAQRSNVTKSVEAAAAIFLRALDNWAELFQRRNQEGPTREEVLGFIGELLLVEGLLSDSSVNPNILIQGWRGPDNDARDLGVNGTRIEAKAQRSTGATKLRISSLAQLDDRGDSVFVVLMRLSPSETGRSLAEIIEALRHRLDGQPLASLEFDRKIVLSGIAIDSELAQETYSLDDRLVYAVAGGFPRLVPGNVPAGVTAVQYEISGPPLDAFRTTWDLLVGAIDG